MLTYPWKCTVLHCNHLGNTWKPLVLMTWHFDYCPSASEGDNQSVRSSAPVVSRCFPGGHNVKLYISRGRLAWWLLAFLHSETSVNTLELCNWREGENEGYFPKANKNNCLSSSKMHICIAVVVWVKIMKYFLIHILNMYSDIDVRLLDVAIICKHLPGHVFNNKSMY